ncbi:hypothetical protein Nmel_011278, partial [Mimus melanotis]
MVFQSKHADTRGNFRLNSSCSVSVGRGGERCYSGQFSQPLAREYHCSP